MNNWVLDKAKAASVGESNYIRGNTYDVYQINSAAWLSNQKPDGSATYYLSLNIMNRHKSSTNIDIYYGNSLGERWSGEQLIHAIMLSANVSELSQAQGPYIAFDYDDKKDKTLQGLVAPELAGKKVGMFLSENWYVKQSTGEVKRGGLNLFNVYDANTMQLPKEKANNQPADKDLFGQVAEAMFKASTKSLEDANAKAGVSNTVNQQLGQGFQQQPENQPQTTYKRNPEPQQFNNQMTANMPTAGGPADDDIPFAPFFGG